MMTMTAAIGEVTVMGNCGHRPPVISCCQCHGALLSTVRRCWTPLFPSDATRNPAALHRAPLSAQHKRLIATSPTTDGHTKSRSQLHTSRSRSSPSFSYYLFLTWTAISWPSGSAVRPVCLLHAQHQQLFPRPHRKIGSHWAVAPSGRARHEDPLRRRKALDRQEHLIHPSPRRRLPVSPRQRQVLSQL